jgi:hypothetical protein
MPKFKIEQVAIYPYNPSIAKKILADLGLTDWSEDHVVAAGQVFGKPGVNEANLSFNYQAGSGSDESAGKPLEFEVLNYTSGESWMDKRDYQVSHLGMHVNDEELEEFRAYFTSMNIGVAQEVFTQSHTNPVIKDSRRYHYVIFDTHGLLGVDLKFIVRHNII